MTFAEAKEIERTLDRLACVLAENRFHWPGNLRDRYEQSINVLKWHQRECGPKKPKTIMERVREAAK